jgi:prepilin-type N-terminal cleavage/methylation domain-containing protein
MNGQHLQRSTNSQSGFSLLELLIAMTITLAVMTAATTLLATSFRVNTQENTRSDALAATQRALNNLSREIGNTGYGLMDNGIVIADSSASSIRVRSNLNNNNTLAEADEDVRYVFQSTNRAIVRFDNFPLPNGTAAVLATNINSMTLTYRDINGAAITNSADYGNAETVTIDIRVDLPAGPEQPASVVRLVSDVALRNAPNTLKRF